MHNNNITTIISVLSHFIIFSLFAQPQNSILLKDDILLVNSQGIAFLGSGVTEEDAKIIAINDAKRSALDRAGIYLESHTTVINYVLVKDEIITFSGSLLKTIILNENRKIINNMFALEIEIEATIDLNVLNETIAMIRENRELEEQLKLERERNKELEAQILHLNQNISTTPGQEVKNLVNALTATEWNRLGLQQNNLYKKIEYFTEAIHLDPNYVTAYYNRGSAFNDLEQYNEAIRDLNKAIELNPGYGKAYNNRGYAHNNLGKYDKAIDDFNQAIKLNPHLVTIYNNRGAAYNKIGRYDEAIRDLNKALDLNPKDAMAYNNRGFAYNDLGKYSAAIQDFSKAIELNPKDATTYFNRGSTYLQLKKYNEAIEDYTKVIELNPQDASTYKHRAIIYMAINQKVNAANNFNNYLKLNGNKSGDADEVRQMIRDLGYIPEY